MAAARVRRGRILGALNYCGVSPMSRKPRLTRSGARESLCPFVAGVIGLAAAVSVSLAAAPPLIPTVSDEPLRVFQRPDGQAYFSLTIRANAQTGAAQSPATRPPLDCVVLFDTSASQAGEYRARGLDLLQKFTARLSPRDRVLLFAVDVDVEKLSSGWAAPNSPEWVATIARLSPRSPLC